MVFWGEEIGIMVRCSPRNEIAEAFEEFTNKNDRKFTNSTKTSPCVGRRNVVIYQCSRQTIRYCKRVGKAHSFVL